MEVFHFCCTHPCDNKAKETDHDIHLGWNPAFKVVFFLLLDFRDLTQKEVSKSRNRVEDLLPCLFLSGTEKLKEVVWFWFPNKEDNRNLPDRKPVDDL